MAEKRMQINLDNRTGLAVDYRAMLGRMHGRIKGKLRLMIAFVLALWCAGAGCVLVSYAHGTAMSNDDSQANAKAEDDWGSLSGSAGSHDCCKARHRALKKPAHSQSKLTDFEQIAMPEVPAPDGARSCCPLTSGSFVAVSRVDSNQLNLALEARSSSVPPALIAAGSVAPEHPLHLRTQNKAYLLDCVFLI